MHGSSTRSTVALTLARACTARVCARAHAVSVSHVDGGGRQGTGGAGRAPAKKARRSPPDAAHNSHTHNTPRRLSRPLSQSQQQDAAAAAAQNEELVNSDEFRMVRHCPRPPLGSLSSTASTAAGLALASDRRLHPVFCTRKGQHTKHEHEHKCNTSPNPIQINTKTTTNQNKQQTQYAFKVLPCPRRTAHEWTTCAYVHPGEKARRRDPRACSYLAVPCPDIKTGAACPRGDDCMYCHSVFGAPAAALRHCLLGGGGASVVLSNRA